MVRRVNKSNTCTSFSCIVRYQVCCLVRELAQHSTSLFQVILQRLRTEDQICRLCAVLIVRSFDWIAYTVS